MWPIRAWFRHAHSQSRRIQNPGDNFFSVAVPESRAGGPLTLTSYVGGERYPELASLPPEQLLALTCEDLRVLLGCHWKTDLPAQRILSASHSPIQRWLWTLSRLMNEAESRAPGLFLAGHYRDGVSLSDSIVSGCNVAERIGRVPGRQENRVSLEAQTYMSSMSKAVLLLNLALRIPRRSAMFVVICASF